VIEIDGHAIRSWDQMVGHIEPNAGEEIELAVARGDSVVVLAIEVGSETERDASTGEEREVGKIGIGPPPVEPLRVRYGLVGSIVEGARLTIDDAGKVLYTLKGMIFGRISPRELGGPIFIGQVSGQFAAAGILPLLFFMAFLSVNLAILNLLPIPVLDGGHLVFLFLEGIRGKPISLGVRMRLTQVGLFVLLGIMVLALTNDVLRVFGG
jgi:regulator of sigma E protease